MVIQNELNNEDPLNTSILTFEEKLAINQGSFAIKPTAVETAPVPMVPSPAAPVLTTTESAPSTITSKTSTTTGSKESTAKKSSVSKRESVPHRKKSPTKVPAKSHGANKSKMTSKTNGQDSSKETSASAGDETKPKIAKKAVRDQVPEKEKVIA